MMARLGEEQNHHDGFNKTHRNILYYGQDISPVQYTPRLAGDKKRNGKKRKSKSRKPKYNNTYIKTIQSPYKILLDKFKNTKTTRL